MGLYKENPRYKCVSARLSDDEWEDLMIVCGQKRTSMSECIREALTALLMENGLGGERVETTG